MKVLLRENISKLGHIGEVVDVKPGHARNYLLPQGLAVSPTEANVRAIEAQKRRYLEQLAREKEQLQARAALAAGKEVTIDARANAEGVLYGSVGPAQIVAALGEQGVLVESNNVVLTEPIRRLDKYDVTLRFAEDVTATIYVWIVPIHGDEDIEQADAAAPEAEHLDVVPEPQEADEASQTEEPADDAVE